MTTLSKDEVVKMAREAGAVFDPQWGIASNIGTATFERFAALCRAPLVAELERLDREADQLIQERDHAENWGTTLATAVSEHFRVPVGEYSNMNDPRSEALEILNGGYVTDSDEERERDALKADSEQLRSALGKALYAMEFHQWNWNSAASDDFKREAVQHVRKAIAKEAA